MLTIYVKGLREIRHNFTCWYICQFVIFWRIKCEILRTKMPNSKVSKQMKSTFNYQWNTIASNVWLSDYLQRIQVYTQYNVRLFSNVPTCHVVRMVHHHNWHVDGWILRNWSEAPLPLSNTRTSWQGGVRARQIRANPPSASSTSRSSAAPSAPSAPSNSRGAGRASSTTVWDFLLLTSLKIRKAIKPKPAVAPTASPINPFFPSGVFISPHSADGGRLGLTFSLTPVTYKCHRPWLSVMNLRMPTTWLDLLHVKYPTLENNTGHAHC